MTIVLLNIESEYCIIVLFIDFSIPKIYIYIYIYIVVYHKLICLYLILRFALYIVWFIFSLYSINSLYLIVEIYIYIYNKVN